MKLAFVKFEKERAGIMCDQCERLRAQLAIEQDALRSCQESWHRVMNNKLAVDKQLASAESQLRLAFFPFRPQARPSEGGDWTDIYPAQLQAFAKGPYDVRAIELPLTDENGKS